MVTMDNSKTVGKYSSTSNKVMYFCVHSEEFYLYIKTNSPSETI